VLGAAHQEHAQGQAEGAQAAGEGAAGRIPGEQDAEQGAELGGVAEDGVRQDLEVAFVLALDGGQDLQQGTASHEYLRRSSEAGPDARFGAASFIHRFGASLNRHAHFDENHPGSRASRALSGAQIRSRRIGHCCVIDGVFEPDEEAGDAPQSVRFRPAAELTPEAVAAMAEQECVRVLRWFAHSGMIEMEDVREALAWENSGSSLNAAVRVGAHGRAGLDRLLGLYDRLLDVRSVEHCCRWHPVERRRVMAGTCR
jgi:hypothetical protein